MVIWGIKILSPFNLYSCTSIANTLHQKTKLMFHDVTNKMVSSGNNHHYSRYHYNSYTLYS